MRLALQIINQLVKFKLRPTAESLDIKQHQRWLVIVSGWRFPKPIPLHRPTRAKSTGYLAAFRAIARAMSIPHTNANSSSRIITSAASTATAIAKFVGS